MLKDLRSLQLFPSGRLVLSLRLWSLAARCQIELFFPNIPAFRRHGVKKRGHAQDSPKELAAWEQRETGREVKFPEQTPPSHPNSRIRKPKVVEDKK